MLADGDGEADTHLAAWSVGTALAQPGHQGVVVVSRPFFVQSIGRMVVEGGWRLPWYEFPQAQVLCKGGRQEQAGIGHQAVVVKDDADTVGIVLWQRFSWEGVRHVQARCSSW